MPNLSTTKPKSSVKIAQEMAKLKAAEKKAKTYKLDLGELSIFTSQLASLLQAGLPLVSCLEALQDQTEDQVFRIVIRDVRNDISTGTSFSAAVKKFPRAFPNLFISMVEAGEASGGLAEILGKVAGYFESTVKLTKKVKSAMTYPVAVIGLAVALVNVLLIFVIPVFAAMFADFGAKLPAPTQMLIDLSDFMKAWWWAVGGAAYGVFFFMSKYVATPNGRRQKDHFLINAPIFGNLIHKIALSRFCRTYATLMRSGVPILYDEQGRRFLRHGVRCDRWRAHLPDRAVAHCLPRHRGRRHCHGDVSAHLPTRGCGRRLAVTAGLCWSDGGSTPTGGGL